jgi:hypothetical protein
MGGFDSLSSLHPQLANLGNAAETASRPETTLIDLRNYLDYALIFLEGQHNIPKVENGGDKLLYRIDRLRDYGVSVSDEMLEALHDVRMYGNWGAHLAGNEHRVASAVPDALRAAHEIRQWLETAYSGGIFVWRAPRGRTFLNIAIGFVILSVVLDFTIWSNSSRHSAPAPEVQKQTFATPQAPKRQSRCVDWSHAEQIVRSNLSEGRRYLAECQRESGPFVLMVAKAVENRMFNEALSCMRSTCAPEGCMSNYAQEFSSGWRLGTLRAEAQAVHTEPRCRPQPPRYRICQHPEPPFKWRCPADARCYPGGGCLR